MATRRANPFKVKIHRSYTITELAEALDIHKNTIGNWQEKGLAAIDRQRPTMFQGSVVRAFLQRRSVNRKSPCPPGTIYCMRCRQPRRPALGMVDYAERKPGTGNLQALCETCGATMHRSARQADLAAIMSGIAVQITLAPSRLKERAAPSLNCALDRKATT